jgi:hypothetical protein
MKNLQTYYLDLRDHSWHKIEAKGEAPPYLSDIKIVKKEDKIYLGKFFYFLLQKNFRK